MSALMRAGPVAEHDDAVGEEQRLLDVMRHQQRGKALALPERDELGLHGDARQRIELAERLVEDQDFGIVHQRARQRDALRHAARKLMRIGVAECRQADEIERRIDALPLALQDALRLQPERDIVPDRSPWKQRRVLKHHDARRDAVPLMRIAVLAQRAGARRLQPRDQPQQGRLAAAGWAEQRDELAGLDAEADIVQHRQHGAVDVEGMADALDVERSAGSRSVIAFGKRERYHFTTPFCQTSNRSRVRNSSVIAPEHSSDITISAAYMLA